MASIGIYPPDHGRLPPLPLKLDDLCSSSYREQLAFMHKTSMWGYGGSEYAKEVILLCNKVRGRTILDYGCGQSNLQQAILSVEPARTDLQVTGYDPGIPGLDQLPQPADVVLCTDVLEHVEPTKVTVVLRHLYELTKHAALVVIATRPAEKRLPDGRNAHLTIDNADWWYRQLAAQGDWLMSVRALDGAAIKLWLRKPGSGK